MTEEQRAIETMNTVEAYTFLTLHLLTHFRGWGFSRGRTTLRHALEHLTSEGKG